MKLKQMRCARADEQGHHQHAEEGGALHHMGLPQPEDCEGADLQARIRKGVARLLVLESACGRDHVMLLFSSTVVL